MMEPMFKLDENLPVEAAEVLRRAGYDASTVLEQNLGGCGDNEVALCCRDEHRAIVTYDLDFADIRSYPPEDFSGIIVFRLEDQSKPRLLRVLESLVVQFEQEELAGKLWIVSDRSLRIRG